MIFSAPCCDDLKAALTAGEDRALRRRCVGTISLLVLICSCLACGTAHNARSASQVPVHGLLTETEAVQLGDAFAHERGWSVKRPAHRATFDSQASEWRMIFRMKHGDFISDHFVFVNDTTREIRYVRGE